MEARVRFGSESASLCALVVRFSVGNGGQTSMSLVKDFGPGPKKTRGDYLKLGTKC